jgi:hypothetical protein
VVNAKLMTRDNLFSRTFGESGEQFLIDGFTAFLETFLEWLF